MSVIIKGMEMPKNGHVVVRIYSDGRVENETTEREIGTARPITEGHGRLIDAEELRKAMYHEAFETDSPMQKWESGCWIRYKMFERNLENAPIIVPAEGGAEDG